MFLSFSVLDDFFRFSKRLGFLVFLVHPTVVLVLLSALLERCFVFRMRDFCLSESDEQPQSVNLDLLNGSPFEKNSFIAVHWNINSILTEGRLEELIENINTLKCHVVILTKSKRRQQYAK